MVDKAHKQNSIDNISKSIFVLTYEKNVVAIEVGVHEADLIDRVIESCYEKIAELNAQITFGD